MSLISVFDLNSAENKFMQVMYIVWGYVKARLELISNDEFLWGPIFCNQMLGFKSKAYIKFYLRSSNVTFDQKYLQNFLMILDFFIQIFIKGKQFWYLRNEKKGFGIDRLTIYQTEISMPILSDSIPGFLVRISKEEFTQIAANGDPNLELFGNEFKLFGPLVFVDHGLGSPFCIKRILVKKYSFTCCTCENLFGRDLLCTKLEW
jgi:hypothetical protein